MRNPTKREIVPKILADSGRPTMRAPKKPLKPKKCRVCPTVFAPRTSLQICCSPRCAGEYAKSSRERKEARESRKEYREAKDKTKSRADWIKEAQKSFNDWVRARDALAPCISCGRYHQGQYHAGHYRTTKAAPELRFCEINVWKQCSVCNNHLSGNILEYRINLIKKGIDVEWLEGPHEPKKYTIPELQEIKAVYKQKLKDLKNS